MASANDNSNNVSILLGKGTGTFSPGVTLATGSHPSSVVSADLNGDGKVDIAVANSWDDNLSLFLGNGNGTFAAATKYATGKLPWELGTGDINGDGKIDIASLNIGNYENSVGVLLGSGAGVFQAPIQQPLSASPAGLAVGSFNGDGKSDIATSASVTNTRGTVSVFLGANCSL